MARVRCETDRLLTWPGEVLRRTEPDTVDVDIVVVDDPLGGTSLQVIIYNAPAPLAGLEVGLVSDGGPAGKAT